MEGGESSSTDKAAEEAPKRGRGRPRKEKTEEPDDAEPKPKRPRGRPKGTFKKPRPTVQKENALLKVDILLDFKAFWRGAFLGIIWPSEHALWDKHPLLSGSDYRGQVLCVVSLSTKITRENIILLSKKKTNNAEMHCSKREREGERERENIHQARQELLGMCANNNPY